MFHVNLPGCNPTKQARKLVKDTPKFRCVYVPGCFSAFSVEVPVVFGASSYGLGWEKGPATSDEAWIHFCQRVAIPSPKWTLCWIFQPTKITLVNPTVFFHPKKTTHRPTKKCVFLLAPPLIQTHIGIGLPQKKSHLNTNVSCQKNKSQRPIHIRIRHGASFLTPQRMHNDHRFTLDKVLVWQGISVLESQTTSGDRSRLKDF